VERQYDKRDSQIDWRDTPVGESVQLERHSCMGVSLIGETLL